MLDSAIYTNNDMYIMTVRCLQVHPSRRLCETENTDWKIALSFFKVKSILMVFFWLLLA